MPRYGFRCPSGTEFDAVYSMALVPDSTECAHCGEQAKRLPGAPFLSNAGSSAFGLIDRAERSAHEPQVVSGSLPGSRRRPGTPTTRNPLHAKLPRS